jgi:hypothetical protein
LDNVTLSKSIKVRKSVQRKRNKLHAGIFVLTAVDKYGKPTEPKGISAKWCNDGTMSQVRKEGIMKGQER